MNISKTLHSRLVVGTGTILIALVGSFAVGAVTADAAVISCPWLATCNGTNNDDHITGSDMGTAMYGYDGHDNMWGMAGSDTINAGDQSDFVQGNPGNDEIFGLYGNDSIDYLAYNGHPGGLYGLNNDDTVRGNDGFDYVSGGEGNDEIYGGDNNDKVWAADCSRDYYGGGQGQNDICWYDPGLDVGDGTCEDPRPTYAC